MRPGEYGHRAQEKREPQREAEQARADGDGPGGPAEDPARERLLPPAEPAHTGAGAAPAVRAGQEAGRAAAGEEALQVPGRLPRVRGRPGGVRGAPPAQEELLGHPREQGQVRGRRRRLEGAQVEGKPDSKAANLQQNSRDVCSF